MYCTVALSSGWLNCPFQCVRHPGIHGWLPASISIQNFHQNVFFLSIEFNLYLLMSESTTQIKNRDHRDLIVKNSFDQVNHSVSQYPFKNFEILLVIRRITTQSRRDRLHILKIGTLMNNRFHTKQLASASSLSLRSLRSRSIQKIIEKFEGSCHLIA